MVYSQERKINCLLWQIFFLQTFTILDKWITMSLWLIYFVSTALAELTSSFVLLDYGFIAVLPSCQRFLRILQNRGEVEYLSLDSHLYWWSIISLTKTKADWARTFFIFSSSYFAFWYQIFSSFLFFFLFSFLHLFLCVLIVWPFGSRTSGLVWAPTQK